MFTEMATFCMLKKLRKFAERIRPILQGSIAKESHIQYEVRAYFLQRRRWYMQFLMSIQCVCKHSPKFSEPFLPNVIPFSLSNLFSKFRKDLKTELDYKRLLRNKKVKMANSKSQNFSKQENFFYLLFGIFAHYCHKELLVYLFAKFLIYY
jgi:hypothetical protein